MARPLEQVRVIKGFEVFLQDVMTFAWHISSSAHFVFRSAAIRQLSKISIIMEFKLINYARGGIPRRLSDGTPQCNSSLESEWEDLQDGMLRSDL